MLLTIKDGLFESVELTKNSGPDKYFYSGFSLTFDSRGTYTHTDSSYASNLIIFRCDLSSSSVHASNRPNSALILGKSIVQKISNTTLYAEKALKTNCKVTNRTFVLSLHYNGNDSYLFVNGVQQVMFNLIHYV